MSDIAHVPDIGEDEDFVEYKAFRQQIRDKIIQTLTIWPRLSPSMLQVGIGTSVKPTLWHPILDSLIKEGIVARDEISMKSHIGRDQVYSVIHLVNEPEIKR